MYRATDALWSGRPNTQLVAEAADLPPGHGAGRRLRRGRRRDLAGRARVAGHRGRLRRARRCERGRGGTPRRAGGGGRPHRLGARRRHPLGARAGQRSTWSRPSSCTCRRSSAGRCSPALAAAVAPRRHAARRRATTSATSPPGAHRPPEPERFFTAEEVAESLDRQRVGRGGGRGSPRPARGTRVRTSPCTTPSSAPQARRETNPTNAVHLMWVSLPPMTPLLLLVARRHLDHGRLSSALCPSDADRRPPSFHPGRAATPTHALGPVVRARALARRGTMSPTRTTRTALRRTLSLIALVPLAVGLAACGGSSSADSGDGRRVRRRPGAPPRLLRERHPRRRADRRPGGPVRQGARRHEAHHPGVQRRPRRGRGAVRRRHRRRLHRAQPDDQRLRAERRRRHPHHRRGRLRRGAARRPRRHRLRRRPQGHDARQPPAGQHPGRRTAHLAHRPGAEEQRRGRR